MVAGDTPGHSQTILWDPGRGLAPGSSDCFSVFERWASGFQGLCEFQWGRSRRTGNQMGEPGSLTQDLLRHCFFPQVKEHLLRIFQKYFSKPIRHLGPDGQRPQVCYILHGYAWVFSGWPHDVMVRKAFHLDPATQHHASQAAAAWWQQHGEARFLGPCGVGLFRGSRSIEQFSEWVFWIFGPERCGIHAV